MVQTDLLQCCRLNRSEQDRTVQCIQRKCGPFRGHSSCIAHCFSKFHCCRFFLLGEDKVSPPPLPTHKRRARARGAGVHFLVRCFQAGKPCAVFDGIRGPIPATSEQFLRCTFQTSLLDPTFLLPCQVIELSRPGQVRRSGPVRPARCHKMKTVVEMWRCFSLDRVPGRRLFHEF